MKDFAKREVHIDKYSISVQCSGLWSVVLHHWEGPPTEDTT